MQQSEDWLLLQRIRMLTYQQMENQLAQHPPKDVILLEHLNFHQLPLVAHIQEHHFLKWRSAYYLNHPYHHEQSIPFVLVL